MTTTKRDYIFPGRWRCALVVIGVLSGILVVAASAAEVKPAVNPKADELLRHMSDYLARAPFFSVDAEIWQDIRLRSGQQVQAGRTVTVQVRRPNHYHAEIRSTRHSRALFYNGKSITLVNRKKNFYGRVPAPATLNEAVDVASDRFGITLPLEDIVVSDPYRSAMRNIVSGIYLGPVTVLGVPCEHLAFSLGSVDWQLWVEQGTKPVPRKIVFTYKDEEGAPEYTVILSKWDFQTQLPDKLFSFEPPAGASRIRVAAIKRHIQARKNRGK